jgi:hypothetical protein
VAIVWVYYREAGRHQLYINADEFNSPRRARFNHNVHYWTDLPRGKPQWLVHDVKGAPNKDAGPVRRGRPNPPGRLSLWSRRRRG